MSSYRDFLAACRRDPPRVALVLGSGLGDSAEGFVVDCSVAYSGVPGLEEPSVPGHEGELRLGRWGGQRVLLFVGRLHYYEGHAWRQVEHQVPMARELGAEILFLTNAAGGIHVDLCPGSLMLIRDHLEWTRSYCWRFPGPGQRPSPYSTRLQETLSKVSAALAVRVTPGVYAQVTGPCYETPAEIRALQSCGADAVGMSTCREINRGHAVGMECVALSCITNRAAGLAAGPIHHDEVLSAGRAARGRLASLIEAFLRAV